MKHSTTPARALWITMYRWLLRRRDPDLWRSHGAEAVRLFESMTHDAWRRRGWPGLCATLWFCFRGLGEAPDRPDGLGARAETVRAPAVGRGVRIALRQAVRALRRRPTYVASVAALLGLGIGAVTTLVSLVDGILLRPLPYPDAERLVVFTEGSHTWPDVEDWRAMGRSYDLVAGVYSEIQALGTVDPVRIRMARISSNFFEGLGATTALGRLPSTAELESDAPVTVVDHGFWLRRWGGDPGLVGRAIQVDGAPLTVIGVLSPSFHDPEALMGLRPELWRPIPNDPARLDRHSRRLSVYGRLRPDVTLAAARDEMDDIEQTLARRYPDEHADAAGRPRRDFGPERLATATVADARRPLVVLLWATMALLGVACANAAALVLAQGTARRSEMAVRTALGAGRRALFGQLLVESLMVAALGGAVGALLAVFGVAWVRDADPGSLPLLARVAVDGRVLVATATVALVTGVVFGLVPALQASRTPPERTLRAAWGRGGGARAQAGLIVVEVALSTVLLAGAGFLLHSFVELTRIDPGFQPAGVVAVQVNFTSGLAEDRRVTLVEAMQERVARVPGVRAVGGGLNVPFDLVGGARCCWWSGLEVDGRTSDDLWVRPVTPGYFEALGIAVEGRPIEVDDASATVVPVVVNRAAARAVFGAAPPLGKRAAMGPMDVRVVGTIEGTRFWGFAEAVEPAMYVSWAALGTWGDRIRFAVATEPGMEEEVAAALQPALREVAPSLAVDPAGRVSDRIAESLAQRAFFLELVGVFALGALILAAAGLYGTLLYEVRRRRRELGIRIALGAERRGVVGLVVRRGMALVGAGVVLGGLAVAPTRRGLGDLLHDAGSSDLWTVVIVVLTLASVGLLATWLPARLAARSDPLSCLQSD